jgi:hypothetical protein
MAYTTKQTKAPRFMTYKGVKIYHLYRHDDATQGDLRIYIYHTNPYGSEDDDGAFDVRDFPGSHASYEDMKQTFRDAIDGGHITKHDPNTSR